jgi:mono/diheme cytochrome c family protein
MNRHHMALNNWWDSLRKDIAATIAMGGALAATLLLMSIVTGCGRSSSAETIDRTADNNAPAATATATTQSRVERGRYMVTIGGCNDCHTPLKMGASGPEPDMSRMLSGHPENFAVPTNAKAAEWVGMTAAATGTAFAGPWGISYAMNLTPDSLTGIGTWTEEMFIKTIRSGRHWGTSRPIMPPMPWFNYAKFTDEDIKSVYAYLRTIPPVHNTIHPHTPPTEMASAAPAGNGH